MHEDKILITPYLLNSPHIYPCWCGLRQDPHIFESSIMGVKTSTLRRAVSFGGGGRRRLLGPPRGYIPVAVGVDEETKRFMVHTKALSNAEFLQFLRRSEEEYGFCNQGILRIQYDAKAFEEWLRTSSKHRDFRIQPTIT